MASVIEEWKYKGLDTVMPVPAPTVHIQGTRGGGFPAQSSYLEEDLPVRSCHQALKRWCTGIRHPTEELEVCAHNLNKRIALRLPTLMQIECLLKCLLKLGLLKLSSGAAIMRSRQQMV
jgi:hypothetical protein